MAYIMFVAIMVGYLLFVFWTFTACPGGRLVSDMNLKHFRCVQDSK